MASDIEVGSIVEDKDHPRTQEKVVVRTPGKTIDQWYVNGSYTVAADNPDYPEDDYVVVVVFKDALEQIRPHYGGVRPLTLSRVDQEYLYSFPESRLRVVGEVTPTEIPLDSVRPSPYHSRSFTVEGNQSFIDKIQDEGKPVGHPVVRPIENGFEIINGHKRIWASIVAGLKSIPVQVKSVDDRRAAELWIRHHYRDYNEDQKRIARQRLRENNHGNAIPAE